MKIYSFNINGIRAATAKGFAKWFLKELPEILAVQEIKAKTPQFPEELINTNYHLYVNEAEKPGYSGVAVFTKVKPNRVYKVLGLKRFDSEGRFLRLDFDDFILINVYMPHGGRQKENLPYKLETYSKLFEYLEKLKNKKLILVGDFNIAHTELDLARPKNNVNNIMFTKEERLQIDKLLEIGFSDSFRVFYSGGGNYSWWPYMANARERNLGWRIDYCFVSNIKSTDAFIASCVPGSDHCPVGIEI